MDPCLADFALTDSVSAQTQIATHVRSLVQSGRLAPGTKLPTTLAMATHWQTRVATVHAALTPLVKEGLLHRRQRAGTFVRALQTQLTRVGIYLPHNFAAGSGTSFYQAVLTSVQAGLARRGLESSIWIDTRPDERSHEPWAELAAAAASRRVEAVIAPVVDLRNLAWLRRLPLYTAFGGSASIPNLVNHDSTQLAELGLRDLAAQGVRRVGLISVIPTPAGTAPQPNQYHAFYQHWGRLAAALKLETRPAWTVTPPPDGWISESDAAHFGYTAIRALWAQSERPDGLLVFSDVAARGVVVGLLELHATVPGDLRLVLHRNVEVGLLCPFPASFLDASTTAYAEALIMQIERQHRGEAVTPITLPFSLTRHPRT